MTAYPSISGTVLSVQNLAQTGSSQDFCSFLLELSTQSGPVSVLLSPSTYVFENESIKAGDRITAFYDPDAPAPLIYPPRYSALVLAETDKGQTAVLDYFDQSLLSSDGNLRLIPDEDTDITTANGQKIRKSPGNRVLLALYSASTRSIPAQTVPEDIVVFCGEEAL